MKSADIIRRLCRLLGIQGGTESPSAGSNPESSVLESNTLVIDVRSPGEFDSGHLRGAVSLPLDRIQLDIAAAVPDRKTPLILYCRSGARSRHACAIVAQLGYESVRNGGGIASLALSLNRAVSRSFR